MKTILTNVRWILFGENGQEETRIEDSITKEDLLKNLKAGKYTLPKTDKWEELNLAYQHHGEHVLITLQNLTSAVEEENYRYKTCTEIFLESVRRNEDLVPTFHGVWLNAHLNNKELLQEEYIAELK